MALAMAGARALAMAMALAGAGAMAVAGAMAMDNENRKGEQMDRDEIEKKISELQQELANAEFKDDPERKYAIVRCRDAGVHAGTVLSVEGRTVHLRDSRRLWYWKGAKTLSEIAVHGVALPKECKFAVTLEDITLLDACEVIKCTAIARDSIRGVPEWKD
jgi:hypothetical protein